MPPNNTTKAPSIVTRFLKKWTKLIIAILSLVTALVALITNSAPSINNTITTGDQVIISSPSNTKQDDRADDRVKRSDAQPPEKSKHSKTEVIQPAYPDLYNPEEQSDFAVAAVINQRSSRMFGQRLVEWLIPVGSASTSILTAKFISQNYFDQILDGNSAILSKMKIKEVTKYLCLARIRSEFHPSDINSSIIIAENHYEIAIFSSVTGALLDHFEETIKSSGVSEKSASDRADQEFMGKLNEKKPQL
jgi:hypothetical protein